MVDCTKMQKVECPNWCLTSVYIVLSSNCVLAWSVAFKQIYAVVLLFNNTMMLLLHEVSFRHSLE